MGRARSFAMATAGEAAGAGAHDEDAELEEPTAVRAQPYGLVLDDDPNDEDGRRMGRGAFMAALREAITEECDRELRTVGRTARGCPDIARWIDHFSRRPAAAIEEAIRLWAAPERPATAQDLIDRVAARARDAVARWARTGVAAMPDGSLATARPVGDPPRAVPSVVASSIDRAVAAETAGVEVFQGPQADAITSRFDAYALAFGRSILLSRSVDVDRSPVGQAILAHELSHVAEQDPASGPVPQALTHDRAGEDRADAVAVGTVARLLGGPSRPLDASRRRGPLALQACTDPVDATQRTALTKAVELAVGDTPKIKAAVLAIYGADFANARVGSVDSQNAAETSSGRTVFSAASLQQATGVLGALVVHEAGHFRDSGGSAAGHPAEGTAYAFELIIAERVQKRLERDSPNDPGLAAVKARVDFLQRMQPGQVVAHGFAQGFRTLNERMILALRVLYTVIDGGALNWGTTKPKGWDPMTRDKAQDWVVALLTEDLDTSTSDAVAFLKWVMPNITAVGEAMKPKPPAR